MWDIAKQRVRLQRAKELTELEVRSRTKELEAANQSLEHEVAERKHAEDAVQATKDELADFIENAAVGLHCVDRDGYILWANKAELDLVGYTSEECVGHHITEFHADPEVIHDILQRLLNGETLRNYEARLRCKDGKIKHVLIDSNGLWKDGEFVHTRCFTRDVTERRRAEEAVRKSREYVENIIGSMIDMLVVVAPDGTIRTVNEATCDVLGYTQEELVGRPATLLFSEEEEEEENTTQLIVSQEALPFKRSVLRRLVKDGAISNIEKSLRAKSGHTIPALMSGSVMRDNDGTIRGIVCVAQDITERKRAEEEFRGMGIALDSAMAGISRLDASGRYAMVSNAYATLCGYEPDEMIGMSWEPTVHPEDRESARAAYREMLAVGKSVIETRGLRKDGSMFDKHVVLIRRCDHDGRFAGHYCLMRDVTERKRAEQELEQFAEAMQRSNQALQEANIVAESANRSKSEFLANMSHELRTPMNGIMGMTELTLGTDLNDEQREQLQTVLECSNSLLTLLNDILDFSKIEAGKVELESIDFEFVPMVEGVMDVLAHRAGEKGLELICHVDPAVPQCVRGDPGRVRQVLVNLVGNAIKFTERGEVMVEVQVEHRNDQEVSLLFTVSDTGIGIPEDRKAAIFENFTQVDGATTRKYGGTGLGLAISRQLVELMGGTILVESTLGQGSTFGFRITLPLAQSQETERSLPGSHSSLAGKRILIVDDNETNRRILHTLLKAWSCCPSLACGGKEALDCLRDAQSDGQGFDVVLLDVQMPEMDGLEVERRIREDSRFGLPQIVFLSSLGTRKELGMDAESQAAAFLTKPIKQSVLYNTLQELFPEKTVARNATEKSTDESAPHRNERRRFAARVLLVEDNPVNRRVATAILKKYGCDVTEAENGRVALDVLETKSFDCVFMDVQMPEMDGFAATGHIRRDTRWRGLPIIAMTAHALKGDRERCLEAGMSDYLSKPVTMEAVRNMLENWAAKSFTIDAPRNAEKNPCDGPDAPEQQPIDVEMALDQLDGDRELLDDVVRVFVDTVPDLLRELRSAFSRSDAKQVRASAHSIKGAASNICAEPIRDLAQRIEEMGKQDELEHLDSALVQLQDHMDRLRAFVDANANE